MLQDRLNSGDEDRFIKHEVVTGNNCTISLQTQMSADKMKSLADNEINHENGY
jgi:hypothetical protein